MLTDVDTVSDWDSVLRVAYQAAMKSLDPSTQNGAVILNNHDQIVAVAANNFPSGVLNTDDRWERPAKYFFVEHAERNAVFAAARAGIRTQGLTMVCPWAACADCARAIVQAGIKTLVRHARSNDPSTTHGRWTDTVAVGDQIMFEGGVTIVGVDPVPGYKLRRNEQLVDTSEL